MDTKVCRKCGVDQPISEFSITDKAYGYRKSSCKKCEAERVRAYYRKCGEYRDRVKARARGEDVQPVREPIDPNATSKVCTKCKQDLPLEAFTQMLSGRHGKSPMCRECRYEIGQKAKASGAWVSWTPEYQRRAKIKALYGIEYEQYEAMLEKQGGKCALCGTTEPGVKGTQHKNFVIDHDHITGKVRGLLCGSCNVWLGNYETLIARASEDRIKQYLHRET